MLCTVEELHRFRSGLICIDRLIAERERLIREIKIMEAKQSRVKGKHGPVPFAVRSVCFSAVWLAVLAFAYVFSDTGFPYYVLAPVPGLLSELVMKVRYEKREMKQQLECTDSMMQEHMAELAVCERKITEAACYVEKKLEKISDKGERPDGADSIAFLDYLISRKPAGSIVSLKGGYGTYISRCRYLTDENASLKETTDRSAARAEYRRIVIQKCREKAESEKNEKCSNSECDKDGE